MRTSIKALLASTLFVAVATPAMADETAPPSDIKITGSAAIVSQYRFRGIAQSDNKPAVQGAITISHSSGFYVSTWGSSATGGDSAVQIGGTEIDVYGGFAHALGDTGINADVGVYGYLYPGATAGNYYEVYGSLSGAVGPVNAKAGVNFAPAQKNLRIYPTHSNTYVYGELSGAIPNTPLTVHSHLGHTGGAFDWTKAYLDYSVGVGATYKNLTLDVSWVGTNVGKKDAALKPVTSPFETYRAAKDVAVVSLTATF